MKGEKLNVCVRKKDNRKLLVFSFSFCVIFSLIWTCLKSAKSPYTHTNISRESVLMNQHVKQEERSEKGRESFILILYICFLCIGSHIKHHIKILIVGISFRDVTGNWKCFRSVLNFIKFEYFYGRKVFCWSLNKMELKKQ